MLKKTILLLLIGCIAISGFAQKNKRKANQKSPKNTYFIMLINGEETPAASYCPNDTIVFDFKSLDPNITDYTYCWKADYHVDTICNISPIFLSFPSVNNYKISLFFEIYLENDSIVKDTLINTVNIDYIRTVLETNVCEGRNISVVNSFGDTLTYTNVLGDILTPWDTLKSASGCDSLIRWHIIMDSYILEEYSISSCDSVIWGDIIVKRPLSSEGDYTTIVERLFYAENPDISCDTLKVLTITIIDTAHLEIIFDQDAFCSGEDMGGSIELETNFTAFDWTYLDKDSLFTVYDKTINIEYPGYYRVLAYMNTSLYDTLPGLRIVNCFQIADTLVEDCPLIIPNVITPNGDGSNDVFGIKKLNPVRANEFSVYDRWGNRVFHQKNYKCIFKDNKYLNEEDAFAGISQSGQKLPDGTYFYAFKYESIPKDKRKTYTGIIVILRE